MRYIIEVPTDESDKNRAFKYPLISCELLVCHNSDLLDIMFFYPYK